MEKYQLEEEKYAVDIVIEDLLKSVDRIVSQLTYFSTDYKDALEKRNEIILNMFQKMKKMVGHIQKKTKQVTARKLEVNRTKEAEMQNHDSIQQSAEELAQVIPEILELLVQLRDENKLLKSKYSELEEKFQIRNNKELMSYQTSFKREDQIQASKDQIQKLTNMILKLNIKLDRMDPEALRGGVKFRRNIQKLTELSDSIAEGEICEIMHNQPPKRPELDDILDSIILAEE
ncbi:MAG: hypothetical protein ACTSPI_09310 [Candidatus Heimdallarchaeaceae archaeon]